ncbi:hypothetical protein KFL_009820040 [Klebsormidium nitens]|uniref:Uncharacterized protein n=1 Tax=Klebsormidium nitens TaxID=105231 RepID=A0A1Y1INV2_KLENI|nr:hypothetical protein KFL_009820040 [Klebsormidium nitens]|eukprot:GAQ92333.1 hypothetical protein KFL_009820040 [Klebsormidium nitens]
MVHLVDPLILFEEKDVTDADLKPILAALAEVDDTAVRSIDEQAEKSAEFELTHPTGPFTHAHVVNTQPYAIIVVAIREKEMRRLQQINMTGGGGPTSLTVGLGLQWAFQSGRVVQFWTFPYQPLQLPDNSAYVVASPISSNG